MLVVRGGFVFFVSVILSASAGTHDAACDSGSAKHISLVSYVRSNLGFLQVLLIQNVKQLTSAAVASCVSTLGLPLAFLPSLPPSSALLLVRDLFLGRVGPPSDSELVMPGRRRDLRYIGGEDQIGIGPIRERGVRPFQDATQDRRQLTPACKDKVILFPTA